MFVLNGNHFSNIMTTSVLNEPPSLISKVFFTFRTSARTCQRLEYFCDFYQNNNLVYQKCGMSEKTRSAILRHTQEFQLLFPDRKVTTHSIYEWCDSFVNKKTIQRVLKQNYTAIGKNSGTYYENS